MPKPEGKWHDLGVVHNPPFDRPILDAVSGAPIDILTCTATRSIWTALSKVGRQPRFTNSNFGTGRTVAAMRAQYGGEESMRLVRVISAGTYSLPQVSN